MSESIGKGRHMGAVVMLGWLFGLIIAIYAAVLRFDPESRRDTEAGGQR